MAYTTIDKPTDYFNTVTWTGTSDATTSVTGVGHQPDFVWIKNRDVADDHTLHDVVRGSTKTLFSNDTASEGTNAESIKSFDTDGFTTGNHRGTGGDAGNGMVAWNWKAGTSFTNDASATSVGTLDSSGSTNQTAGFSIVSFTGSGSANQSVAHNLGGTPEMIIFKCRETATDWTTFHTKLGGANKNLSLNSTSAAGTDTDFFANTNPTSTIFSVGAASNTNRGSEGMIAYCFRSIKGYSKFGSYEGNGVASGGGPFIYLGFKPAFFLLKEIDGADNWTLMDNKRLGYNKLNHHLFPNLNNAEYASDRLELMSNGVKVIDNDGSINQSGQTYIYMAFAESPFVSSGGVPTTAR